MIYRLERGAGGLKRTATNNWNQSVVAGTKNDLFCTERTCDCERSRVIFPVRREVKSRNKSVFTGYKLVHVIEFLLIVFRAKKLAVS